MNRLVLGTSAVNCMCGSKELVCCKNRWLCSTFQIKKVSSTYLSQSLGGWGVELRPWFQTFHEQVSYNKADGGTHGCIMDLFIILTLEEEIGILDRIPAIW